jgi:hypothetical protein
MSLNISNLINNFKGLQIQDEKILFNEETLNGISTSFNQAIETSPCNIVIDKPYGIVALTDKYLRDYSITTFHYIDFRWYSIQMGAKIMHKANIEEWQGSNNYSCNFSKSPMRYSGDVCGIMPGDYRDCFEEIISKEKTNKLLTEYDIKSPLQKTNKRIKVQCGIGLESLTIIEKFTKENYQKLSLNYIF